MKFVLAIIVCIGLYLCGISAEPSKRKEIDASEFEQLRKFFVEHLKYSNFPKTSEDYKNLVDRYWDYKKLLDDPKKYIALSHNHPATFKSYREKHRQYQQILDKVEDTYGQFVRNSAISLPFLHLKETYNLLSHSFIQLYKADYNFQLKCILAFEEKISPNLITSSHHKEVAFNTLVEQLDIFFDDLENSGIGNGATKELKEISTKVDTCRFLGFWFEPYCGPDAMKNAIEEMIKQKKAENIELSEKAAKVMVLLKKFKDGEEDKNYPATPESPPKSTSKIKSMTKKLFGASPSY